MDLSDSFDFLPPCSSSISVTDSVNNNSKTSSTQPIEPIIQVLFPSEDKIRDYLTLDQDENNKNPTINSLNSENLDTAKFHRKIHHLIEPTQVECASQDVISTSIFSGTFDQFRDDVHHNLNFSLNFIGNGNSVESYVYHHDYQWLQGTENNSQLTYSNYMNPEANFLLLTRLGYRFTITTNTDNDKVKETWNPNVAEKILSAFYSPLGLKGNYLSTQVLLDQFESFILKELVEAFQTKTIVSDFALKTKLSPSPAQLISTCGRIQSFKKLCNNDKIVLFSNTIYDVTAWKAIFYYNQSMDGWMDPESNKLIQRRNCFIWDHTFHDATVFAIEKLPDRWRNHPAIDVLISMINIFNPDQPGLKYDEVVRQERYLYIYLLQRYLESVCESPCEISDNLYRLMVGVERCKELGKILCTIIDNSDIGCTRLLRSWIMSRIQT